MTKYWNATTAQYVNENGQAVSNNTLLSFSDDSVSASVRAIDELAERVTAGSLTPAAWHEAMRQELKEEYIRQYLLGRGGLDQMKAEDWGSIGGSLADQYRYLNGFYDQVAAGNLTAGQIKMRGVERAAMYVNSAREAFFRAQARARGFDPADLPYHPCDGGTKCLTRCNCFWEYDPVYDDAGKVVIGYDCYWRLGASSQYCDDCKSRSRESAPYKIRF